MITTLCLAFALQAGSLEEALADAEKLGAQGQFAAAVSTLEDAGVTDSTDAMAWLAYATWSTRALENDLAAGRIGGLEVVDAFTDVAWMLEKASGFDGAPVQVWVDWSEALLNANDLRNSLKVLEDGLDQHANAAPLFEQRGRVQMAQARNAAGNGDAEEATKLQDAAESSFRKAIAAAPETASPRMRLAELLWTRYVEGGAESASLKRDAIASWTAAAKEDAAGVDPGMVYNWLGIESVPVFDQLIQSQPDQVLHYWYRGSAFYALGPDQWPGLRDDFLKVLELNPEFTNAYYFLADGAMRRGTQQSQGGDQETAEKAYRASAGFWARYLEGFGDQYRMQVKQGEDGGRAAAENMNWLAGKTSFADGVVLLRWAVGTVPDYADAWNNLAYFLRETRQPEAARDAYARAFELKPDDPTVMNDYAVVLHYYLQERMDFAEELYVKAAARAEAMLEANEFDDEAHKSRIQIALRDSRNNLRRIQAGEITQ
jgi:tetratricopeptide (TPR) repeat protein